MSLSRNLIAGLANSIWGALLGLAVVPYYLKHLGIESYGLIGFFVTTQAVIGLLDMGFSPTINREVARHSALGTLPEAGRLLHTLAIVYWCMAGAIAILIFALAPYIAEYWLQSKQLSAQTIENAIMLMGLVLASRWPIGLYQGALMGAQRLNVSSSISMVMTSISSLGAVAVLAFVSPTIEAFFIWQAVVGLLYALVMRLVAWRIIGRIRGNHFDVSALKKIWRFSIGMATVSVLAVVLTQLDKVLLSGLLSLQDFGHYSLAGVLVSGLSIIIMPTFNVIYPRLVSFVVEGNTEKLMHFYRIGTRLLSAVLFPVAIAAAIFAEEILILWTGNHSISSSAAPIASLLLLGTSLNGVMIFPYALQLAYGKIRLTLIITAVLTVILGPIIFYSVLSFGAVGGGLAWLLLNWLYLFFGTWLTHRYLLKGLSLDWLIYDVGINFCISLTVVLGGEYLLHTSDNEIFNVFLASLLAMISFLLCIFFWLGPDVKKIMNKKFFINILQMER